MILNSPKNIALLTKMNNTNKYMIIATAAILHPIPVLSIFDFKLTIHTSYILYDQDELCYFEEYRFRSYIDR